MRWKWSAFKFRAKWTLFQNKKCEWVFKLKLTIKLAIRRLFGGLFRRSRVVIHKVCKLDANGYKDPLQCFNPSTLSWTGPWDHKAHALAESVPELNNLGAREGVYVVVGLGDFSDDYALHSADALKDDLDMGQIDQGIMRDETNPDKPDKLLIVDPITFEGGIIAHDVSDPAVNDAPLDPCLEACPQEEDDSSWLIPVIAGGASCCFLVAILAFYVRRRRHPRVQFSEFAARMGALTDDEEHMGANKTVQHGTYGKLGDDPEEDERFRRNPTPTQSFGEQRSPRRAGSRRPGAPEEMSEMCTSPTLHGKEVLEHGVV